MINFLSEISISRRGMEVYPENGMPRETTLALQKKGHHIFQNSPLVNQVGGGQAIYLDRGQNILLGVSDRRKDGCAIGF
jgi:gamma-glutamyltranspeptidase